MSAPSGARQRYSRGLPVLFLARALCSCTSVPVDAVCSVDHASWEMEVEEPHRPQLDLLLVIDNSASMAYKQAALALTFRQLIDSVSYEGFEVDYHIGVVSTDVGSWVAEGQPWTVPLGACDSFAGDDGRLQASSCLDRQNVSAAAARECSQRCPDRRFLPQDGASFLRRHNGVTNVPVAMEKDPQTDLLVDRGPEYALTCMALLGDGGCAMSSPLEAMKRALDGHLPDNRAFLRPDSQLQVLFLTDKDDCSVQAARRAENDPQTRDCTTPALDAAYDCFSPGFRCLAHDLSCDQPLNTTGVKTGCFERADSYLQPVVDYAGFLRQLRPTGGLFFAGLWPLPALNGSGSWVVAQNPQVAGSAGLEAATDWQAACQAAGNPAWTGQPQRRLSQLASMFRSYEGFGQEFNICEPESFVQDIQQVELWPAHSAVMSCVWDGAPRLLADGRPDCVASDVTWTGDAFLEAPAMPQCSPACCAAMPSAKNLNWGWTWDNAAVAACASEPVDCFCVTPTENCYDGSTYAVGAWRAGNADLPNETGVLVRCAVQSPLDSICQTR